MMKERVWLVILSLVLISCFALMGVITPAIRDGGMPDDLMGVLGLLITISFVANIIIAYRYARKTGRRAGLYALGTFILPYVVPIVLAFIHCKSSGIEVSGTSESVMSSRDPEMIKDINNVNSISRDYFSSISSPASKFSKWQLDRLRLFSIIIPLSFNWKVVSNSQERSYVFPDLLNPEEEADLYGELEELCSSGKSSSLSGIKICLSDYQNNGTVIGLRKLGKGRMELLAGLFHFRGKRKEILSDWMKTNPQVTLRGGFGSTAVLNKEGFHRKKKSIPWPEVMGLSTETANGIVTHMYVLPEGHSGGMFDFGKTKYSLPNIPTRNKELYVAEVQFWRLAME